MPWQREGNFNGYVDIQTNDEFQILGDEYNVMLDRLKELIEKNKELSELRTIIEVKHRNRSSIRILFLMFWKPCAMPLRSTPIRLRTSC